MLAAPAWLALLPGCGKRADDPLTLLAADPAFTPLGPPPRGGWRTQVDEPPQSLADYQADQPNRPTAQRSTLVLQPLGPYPDREILPGDLPAIAIEEEGFISYVFSPTPSRLAEFLEAFYGLPTRVEAERALIDLAPEPVRTFNHHAQFDARALLATLATTLPEDAYSLTALMVRDLVVETPQEYAFGYGLHRERLAVVSFAQLDPLFGGRPRSPDFQRLIRERCYKLVTHEVGHTLGIGHCQEHACVMNGIAHIDELDATPLRLCPLCLRKLLWLHPQDLRRRYAALADHYRANDLDGEAEWAQGRLATLANP